MADLPKTDVNPTKIKTWYGLLGLFLCVFEGLLGYWLFQAQNTVERSIAGLCMTGIMVFFLLVVMRLQLSRFESRRVAPKGLGEVTPATERVSEQEITPETLSGPDRSYLVAKPPGDWIMEEMTFAEWAAVGFGGTDSQTGQPAGAVPQAKDVLVFRSKREFFVIPVIEKTTINGTKVPTALETRLSIRLSIVPLDRAQPPLYIEKTLVDNFLSVVGIISSTALFRGSGIREGNLPGSQLRFSFAEFHQQIDDAIVDGKPGSGIESVTAIFAIGGELRDYLLVMNYPSQPKLADAGLEQSLKTLQSLVNSFRLLTVINPEQKQQELREAAQQKFKAFLAVGGPQIFLTEFSVVTKKLKSLNLDDPEQRLDAMRVIKRFESLAKSLKVENAELDALWGALQQAEAGNATAFKEQLKRVIRLVEEPPKEVAPVSPAALPAVLDKSEAAAS